MAIPSFNISEALTTNTASPNSLIIDLFSTARIFSFSPSRYLSSALFDLRSFNVSMHSCIPSAQAIFTSMDLLLSFSCTLLENQTIANDTGSTHNDASAIRQSIIIRHTAMRLVEIIDPASSGIKCEKLCSRKVQSAMIVLVRSARSFLPKNESGSFLSLSASVTLRTPLSTYVAKYVALYCMNVASIINNTHAIHAIMKKTA